MESNQFLATTFKILENSGFHNLRADSEFVYMEDPSCILRSFEDFIEHAWFILAIVTVLLLTGWAVALIRGAKYDNLVVNMRNLILILVGITLIKPAINFIYGDDLFARGCRTIKVSQKEIQRLLDSRTDALKKYDQNQLYEDLIIQDSGPTFLKTADYSQNTYQPQEQITETTETTEITEVQVTVSQPDTPGGPDTPVPSPEPVNVASLATNATESGKDVIYTMPDGNKVKRSGGTRAWRNSNPGNIRYSKFAQNVGAIGQAGGFAVFPDEATGMYAIEALLRTDSYNKLTVAGAIERYAPPSENDTAAYHRNIERLTGLSINKRMSDLTPTELTSVANAIRQIEGWKEGTTQRL